MGEQLELTKLKLEAMQNDLRKLQEDLFTHPDLTTNTVDLLENVLYDHADLLENVPYNHADYLLGETS
jgi:hypothetical protein